MNKFLGTLLIVLLVGCGPQAADQNQTPSTTTDTTGDFDVRFVRPLDGDTVATPVGIVMEARGLTLMPAGEMVEGAGHLHIMIDTLFVPAGQVIPKNDQHLHFGDASTETQIELAPGEHVLRLQFGDGAHIALEGDGYRDEIRIVVQ